MDPIKKMVVEQYQQKRGVKPDLDSILMAVPQKYLIELGYNLVVPKALKGKDKKAVMVEQIKNQLLSEKNVSDILFSLNDNQYEALLILLDKRNSIDLDEQYKNLLLVEEGLAFIFTENKQPFLHIPEASVQAIKTVLSRENFEENRKRYQEIINDVDAYVEFYGLITFDFLRALLKQYSEIEMSMASLRDLVMKIRRFSYSSSVDEEALYSGYLDDNGMLYEHLIEEVHEHYMPVDKKALHEMSEYGLPYNGILWNKGMAFLKKTRKESEQNKKGTILPEMSDILTDWIRWTRYGFIDGVFDDLERYGIDIAKYFSEIERLTLSFVNNVRLWELGGYTRLEKEIPITDLRHANDNRDTYVWNDEDFDMDSDLMYDAMPYPGVLIDRDLDLKTILDYPTIYENDYFDVITSYIDDCGYEGIDDYLKMHLMSMLLQMDIRQFGLLKALKKAGGILEINHVAKYFRNPETIYLLPNLMWMIAGYDNGKVYIVMPKEIIALLDKINLKDYESTVIRNTELVSIFNGFLRLVGVYKKGALLRYVDTFFDEVIYDEIKQSILNRSNDFNTEFNEWNGYYAYLDSESCTKLLEEQKNSGIDKFNTFTKNMLIQWSDYDYLMESKSTRTFLQFLKKGVGMKKDEARDFALMVQAMVNEGLDPEEIYSAIGEIMDTEAYIIKDVFMPTMLPFISNIPQPRYKGYSLNEKNQMLNGQSNTTEPNNVFSFESRKKVGRNEPCPCGSGKKYKHCCGRS